VKEKGNEEEENDGAAECEGERARATLDVTPRGSSTINNNNNSLFVDVTAPADESKAHHFLSSSPLPDLPRIPGMGPSSSSAAAASSGVDEGGYYRESNIDTRDSSGDLLNRTSSSNGSSGRSSSKPSTERKQPLRAENVALVSVLFTRTKQPAPLVQPIAAIRPPGVLSGASGGGPAAPGGSVRGDGGGSMRGSLSARFMSGSSQASSVLMRRLTGASPLAEEGETGGGAGGCFRSSNTTNRESWVEFAEMPPPSTNNV
jgi:hypothetical protein